MADLARALEAADEVLVAARPLLDPDTRADLQARLDAARRRHGHLGPTVVAALVGGTGSGKSSLLNALAGTQVVEAGVLRPTTDRPTAWIPRGGGVPLDRLLDDLAVDRRVPHDHDTDVALLDLPDLDSVEQAHRRTVDALLPRVDLVVWVLDPQKYNDLQVHELVRDRRRWAEELVFVLNQVDRLPTADRAAVVDDLVASLRDDGIPDPTVITTTAAPPDGRPPDVDALWVELRRRAADKELVLRKLGEDLDDIADRVAEATGVTDSPAADVEARWQDLVGAVATAAADAVVDDTAVAAAARTGTRVAAATGSGPVGRLWHVVRTSVVGRALGAPQDDVRDDADTPTRHASLEPAVHDLHRGVLDLAVDVGGPLGRRIRGALAGDQAGTALRGAVRDATATVDPGVPRRGWWWGVAVLQTLLTIAVVVGAVWAWSDPAALRPGDLPWPAVLVVGGLVLAVALRAVLRASGAAAGRRAARRRHDRVASEVESGLDRRLGASLADLLDDHRRLVAALDRLRLER